MDISEVADLLSYLVTVSSVEDDIKNILDDYGNIVYVDHGTTHVVIEIQNSSNNVYKVSYSSEGERANETEVNRFKTSKPIGCGKLLLLISDSGEKSKWVSYATTEVVGLSVNCAGCQFPETFTVPDIKAS